MKKRILIIIISSLAAVLLFAVTALRLGNSLQNGEIDKLSYEMGLNGNIEMLAVFFFELIADIVYFFCHFKTRGKFDNMLRILLAFLSSVGIAFICIDPRWRLIDEIGFMLYFYIALAIVAIRIIYCVFKMITVKTNSKGN